MTEAPPAGGAGRRRLVMAGLTLVVFAFIFTRSMTRFLDLDEHQFVAPPELLVQEGLFPYVDYPYFHMPNLVYVYAGLMAWLPYRLLAARTVSAACGTATVMLLFATGWRLFAHTPGRTRWLMAGGISLIFASSRLFTYTNGWAWNHDTAVLCALTALLMQLRGLERGTLWCFAGAGFLAGMATGIRLSFAVTVVPLAVSLWICRSPLTRKERWLGLASGVAGATVALLPAIVPMLTVPDRFFFGNLGYARLSTRFYASYNAPAARWSGRFWSTLKIFLGDPGNAVLLGLFVYTAGILFWRLRLWRSELRNELLLTMGLLPALLLGAWGPAPTQYQYLYMALPFMTLVVLYVSALQWQDARARTRWSSIVLTCLVLAAGTGLPRWYWTIIYLPVPERWTPVAVHRTSAWVKAHVPAGGRVLTLDPLIPLETGVRVYPEYAVGRFIMHVGRFQTVAERQRLRMAWGENLVRMLAERPPDAVLLEDRVAPAAPEFIQYANAHSFTKLEMVQSVPGMDHRFMLWVRPNGGR